MRDILMPIPIVKTAIESDEAGVIDVLKLAFVADPATRWVWPDPIKIPFHIFLVSRLLEETVVYESDYVGDFYWCSPLASTVDL